MRTRSVMGPVALAALGLLGACGHPDRPAPISEPVYSTATVQYGTVRSIEAVRVGDRTSGGGALIGGAVGAVAGNQVGSGSGRAAATVLGAIGGAVIGNQIERNRADARDVVRVTVRYDSGYVRSYDYESVGSLRVGDRVYTDGQHVYRG